MATLRVRYRTGDMDEWELHERPPLSKLAEHLFRASASSSHTVAFGVASRSGEEIDYGMVCLRMDEVAMWEIDGFVDEERLLSWWQLGE